MALGSLADAYNWLQSVLLTTQQTVNGRQMLVAASVADPLHSPTLLNGFANFDGGATFDTAGYYKEGTRVYLRGVLKNTAMPSSGANIFTLPSGYRPLHRLIFTMEMGTTAGGLASGRVDVFPDGSVEWIAGDYGFISLSQISFPAEQ